MTRSQLGEPELLTGDRLRETVADQLGRARARTETLTGAVDDADLVRQHSTLMSPLVWDLAHIGNQEELWLLRDVGGRAGVRPDIDELYDAFKHARAARPELPLLDPGQARGYVGTVREEVLRVLDTVPLEGNRLVDRGFAFGMIVQHEQQHDETMLATHQLRTGPAVLHAADPPPAPADAATLPAEVFVPGGPFTMGTSTEPWALDNERPAHQVDVPGFWLDTTPVSNAAYREFVDAGGYHDPHWWTEDGWAHRTGARLAAPRFWQRDGATGDWWRTRFGVTEPMPADEPVVHVCFHEASAYAAFRGRRLPTEAEWEKAARWDPATDRSRRYPWGDDDPAERHANLGQRHLRPAPVGSYPDGASPLGIRQLIGDVWEWCADGFTAYPGFGAFPYREYSEVFFGGDYRMLRGGSFGTAEVATRATFRNWDHPIRRQIFSGLRTARDADPGGR
jgi:iron(II)-dependent oxidoreductase